MRRVTIRAADIVAPVFASPEIITFLFAGMTRQTSLGDFLRRLILEGDYFRRVTLFQVGFAGSMASFAARHFVFPTADFGETGVRSKRERFELILVTILTGLAADVITIERRGQ